MRAWSPNLSPSDTMIKMKMTTLTRLLLLSSFTYIACTISVAQHMNAPGNSCLSAGPDSSITQCFVEASQAADKDLNSYYGKLRKHLDSDSWKDLQEAERLWMQFRDANCKAEYNLYEGGSAGPTVRAACLESETRQRTADLRTMYDWTLDK